YTISRLNQEVRELLEGHFPLLWIEGEISNLARPSSGHLYFALKDAQTQVRCAMFRPRNRNLGFIPDNGMQVLVRARVSLYEGRGEFQLIVEEIELAGDGALRRAFELLKQRLAAQGLFDAAHKRPLPRLPRRIGVITSPTGAAIRDIVTTLRRRFPAIAVLIYPVPVQGVGSAEKIARAIRLASERADCDVLIVARGGGSLEDLWAFNEEAVARAMYDSTIPIVAGIGHETDITIADFVADQRAATPTAAAELVSPDATEWVQQFVRYQRRLATLIQTEIKYRHQALHGLGQRVQHPRQLLFRQAQRLDELEQRLHHARRVFYRHAASRLAELTAHLQRYSPMQRLIQAHLACDHLGHRLRASLSLLVERRRGQLTSVTRALDAVSPLATLSRGYAIIKRLPDGRLVRTVRDVTVGDHIEARLAQGSLLCSVDKIHEE
ncbi:MAG TPA: exodeoxyribonuclease VII large subunit, partial [Gammaproteobacteria bacterium]|nr:exodeoxyribonuclease VII large subunit [Gammaproteobacteria bacterium]